MEGKETIGSEEGWGVNELFSCLLEHVSTHICRKGSRRTSSGKPTLLCDVCNTVPTNSSHAQVTLTIAGLFFFGRCLLVGVEWCELDGGGGLGTTLFTKAWLFCAAVLLWAGR